MKKIIFAVIFIALLVGLASLIPNSPGTAYPPSTPLPPVYVYYPEWAAYDCRVVSWIHIVWRDPPPEVTPFDEINRGWLQVNYGSHTDSVRWDYYWYETVGGVPTFNWATYYDKPSESYYLSGWVHSTNGGDYWIYPPQFSPPCDNSRNIYLPYVRK